MATSMDEARALSKCKCGATDELAMNDSGDLRCPECIEREREEEEEDDVFGLDDEDLLEFGASSVWSSTIHQGITAWWQLQHQFNYAPLLTRAVIYRDFTVSIKGK